MRVLGLIPARGGSKGVPRKNARVLAGKPLLVWTADAALAASRLNRVVLSTEDPELADLGRSCGIEVPFMRPPELAQDSSPMIDVIMHALDWVGSEGADFDVLCLLQPTNPLRTAGDIDAAIEAFEASGADTMFSTLAIPDDHHPAWAYVADRDGSLRLATGEAQPIARRQDLPPAFHREGSIYLVRVDVLLATGSLYGSRLAGFPMSAERSVNIDTMEDWHRAEQVLGGAQ